MKIAYADPPYIGQAKRHYSKEELCAEVNHEELIKKLSIYDGWALSASSPSLKQILALCPDNVRIGSWVKPFCSYKPKVNPAYAWEPVIFVPARTNGGIRLSKDWVACNITLKRGLAGAKPRLFCNWLFQLLGMQPDDEFDDLFVGTGAVTNAWQQYRAQLLAQQRLGFDPREYGEELPQ